MSDNVHPWPKKPAGRANASLPKPITRPCDFRLMGAISDLETQVGTIEAYNRLATAAAALKAKIDAGSKDQDAENYYRIASVSNVNNSDQNQANAKLIGAAPDLLMALREIADDYADRFDMDSQSTNPGMKYVVRQARAAIEKATGCAA